MPLDDRPLAPLLLASIALATGCGDAVRIAGYVGETPFRLHYRLSAPVAELAGPGERISIWLHQVEGGALSLWESDRHGLVQEGVLEVPANLRSSYPAPDAYRGPPVFLMQATVDPDRSSPGLASLDHWLVHRPEYPKVVETGEEVVPIGIRRWPTDIPTGYSLVGRTCSAETFVQFERVPAETVVELRKLTAGNEPSAYTFDRERYDATFFEGCGLPPPPPLPGLRISEEPASELVFAPDSETLFVLHLPDEGRPLSFAPTVSTWAPDGALTPVASGVFRGRLQVAAASAVTIDAFESRDPVLVQLSPGPTPGPWTTRRLPVPSDGILSPQGDRVAFAAGGRGIEQVAVHEIAAGTTRQLGPGKPLAWSPDGARLLIGVRTAAQPLMLQALDGSPPAPLPWRPSRAIAQPPNVPRTDSTLYLFGAEGPLLLQRRGLPVPSQSEPADLGQPLHPTLAALDLRAGSERIVLDGLRGPVAGQFAMSPDRRSVLAWTVSCPGLGDAYCAAELHQIALADGTYQTLLRTQRPGPVALARDGRTLAVSGAEGVFVTTLR